MQQQLICNLVKKKYRLLLALYARYLNLGYEHYISNRYNSTIKLAKIKLLEKAIRREFPLKDNILSQLQKQFIIENLSLYLLLEPLKSWKYLASCQNPDSDEQISDIIDNITSPLSRFLMVLNNENPSTYLPMQFLLSANLMLKLFNSKSKLMRKLKWSKRSRIGKLRGLWKNAFIILSIVKSKKLKFHLAVLLNSTKIMIEKYSNNKQPRIEFLDVLKIYVYSILQFVFIKRRTITKKGI